jgi:hypothetical protein
VQIGVQVGKRLVLRGALVKVDLMVGEEGAAGQLDQPPPGRPSKFSTSSCTSPMTASPDRTQPALTHNTLHRSNQNGS